MAPGKWRTFERSFNLIVISPIVLKFSMVASKANHLVAYSSLFGQFAWTEMIRNGLPQQWEATSQSMHRPGLYKIIKGRLS